jgi:hypothetical protein
LFDFHRSENWYLITVFLIQLIDKVNHSGTILPSVFPPVTEARFSTKRINIALMDSDYSPNYLNYSHSCHLTIESVLRLIKNNTLILL